MEAAQRTPHRSGAWRLAKLWCRGAGGIPGFLYGAATQAKPASPGCDPLPRPAPAHKALSPASGVGPASSGSPPVSPTFSFLTYLSSG